MSRSLWQLILGAVEEREWPDSESASERSAKHYEAGLDMVNSYRGQPDVLVEALEHFQNCESSGYANAGIAAVLMTAAYERGDAYDGDGLRVAESYLKEAQKTLQARPEVDHLAAKLCLLRNHDSEARRILDELGNTGPSSFFVSSVELWYWYNKRDIRNAKRAFEVARRLARSAAQRELIANQMAGCYQSFGDPAEAISAYRGITELAPDDPWAWHNLSIQYLQGGDIKQAENCNTKALRLMDFPAAREMQQAIRERKGGFLNSLGRMFGSN